jgi:hypothetical protein
MWKVGNGASHQTQVEHLLTKSTYEDCSFFTITPYSCRQNFPVTMRSQWHADDAQDIGTALAVSMRAVLLYRDIHTTRYERIAALYDQVAPREAALLTTIELLYAG